MKKILLLLSITLLSLTASAQNTSSLPYWPLLLKQSSIAGNDSVLVFNHTTLKYQKMSWTDLKTAMSGDYIKRDGTSSATTGKIKLGNAQGLTTDTTCFVDPNNTVGVLNFGSNQAYDYFQVLSKNQINFYNNRATGFTSSLLMNSLGCAIYNDNGTESNNIHTDGDGSLTLNSTANVKIDAYDGVRLSSGTTFGGVIKSTNITASDKTYQLPNASGTLALTSDIPAPIGFTPENVANKATDFNVLNNTKYPTTYAVDSLNMYSHSYFYEGITFKRSRLAQAKKSPFVNNGGQTNSPNNVVFLGDSRFGYGTSYLVDQISQYGKLNSLGFVSFYTQPYGSNIQFDSVPGTTQRARNITTSNATWGISGSYVIANSGAIFTIKPSENFYRFDQFTVWYNTTSGGGSFTYAIDGGSAVTVNTANTSGTDSLGYTTVSSGMLSSTTHTIVITITSGSVRFYGIDFALKAYPGYCVHVIQSGGSQAAQWKLNPGYTKKFIALKNPSFVQFWLGTNDAGDLGVGSSAATFISNYKSLITQLQLPATCSPILTTDMPRALNSDPTKEDTLCNKLLLKYNAEIMKCRRDSGWSVYDLANLWPTWRYAKDNGMYTDAVHPSNPGIQYVYSQMISNLSPVMYNESVAGNKNFRNTSVLFPANGVAGIEIASYASNGYPSSTTTGLFFNPGAYFQFKQNATQVLDIGNGTIFRAYPTSTMSDVIRAYRQGSTVNTAFQLTVNADVSTTFSCSNAPLRFSTNYLTSSGGMYFGSSSTQPTAWIHTAAGTSTMAPIIITNGVRLSTKVSGAFGRSSLNLFWTNGSLVENRILMTTALADGQVLYGKASDSTATSASTFTYNASTGLATNGVTTNKLIGTGSAPTIAAGAGAGTSPTVSITGTDVAGYLTITTGTLPTVSATVVTVTFASAYASAPRTVLITPANANAAALAGTTMTWADQGDITTSSFKLTSGSAGLAATLTYKFYYTVIQ